MVNKYVIKTKNKSLSFLNGYICKSESKDHFIRHLGYKFGNRLNIVMLNNAYKTGDIIIDIHKSFKKESPTEWPKEDKNPKPNIVAEYWGSYGYILEIDKGGIDNPKIETRLFVNDKEAIQWVKSHN